MPEVEPTRKRSRSTDSEEQKNHKRVNTGATAVNGSGPASRQSANTDINMHEPSSSAAQQQTSSSDAVKKEDDSDRARDSATTSGEPSAASGAPAPSANIHMRCLIVTQDASIIIGKGGSHVNEIREKSGARVMVSESIPGNPERILNVSGPLDAVSKVRPVVRSHLLTV